MVLIDIQGMIATLATIAVCAGILSWFILTAKASHKRARAVWEEFAAHHDLAFSGDKSNQELTLKGTVDGCEIEVRTIKRRVGRHVDIHTCFLAEIAAPLPADFRVYRQTATGAIATALGAQDIQVGHPTLDGMFIIKGGDEQAVRGLLRHTLVRNALIKVGELAPQLVIENGWAVVDLGVFIADSSTLEGHIAAVVHVATTLKQALEAPRVNAE